VHYSCGPGQCRPACVPEGLAPNSSAACNYGKGNFSIISRAFPNGLPGALIAIEFRHPSWVRGETQPTGTMNFLRSHGLHYTSIDAPEDSILPLLSMLPATRSMFAFMARTARTGSNAALQQPSVQTFVFGTGASSRSPKDAAI
jgi:hypothetical protein